MPLVTSFKQVDGQGRLNPTQVIARVKTFGVAEQAPIVQIDTMGSSDREMPGKVSQVIQLNRDSAQQLFAILKKTYGF